MKGEGRKRVTIITTTKPRHCKALGNFFHSKTIFTGNKVNMCYKGFFMHELTKKEHFSEQKKSRHDMQERSLRLL